jgi:hypothetical protein
MKNRTITVLASIMIASLALAGCPNLRVGQVRLAAPPKAGKLTLQVDVETNFEVKPEEEKQPQEVSGQGVVAFWLPPGWKATAARMHAPYAEGSETLTLVPEIASRFPPTFPHQEGQWWAFVTGDMRISVGRMAFPVEVDIEGPARARKLVLGIAVGAIDNCEVRHETGWEPGDELPTEVAIDLRQGTIAVRDNPAPVDTQLPGCVKRPEPDAGLEDDAGTEPDACARQCAEVPVYDCDCPKCPPPVERGPRGCSCHGPGAPPPAPGLLGLLIGLVS